MQNSGNYTFMNLLSVRKVQNLNIKVKIQAQLPARRPEARREDPALISPRRGGVYLRLQME